MKNSFILALALAFCASCLFCTTSATQVRYQNGGSASVSINTNTPGNYSVNNQSSSSIVTITPIDCENRWTDFYDYNIEKTYKRQGKPYFTEGLTFKDANTLLESTGLYGESEIHYVNLNNMKVKKQTPLDDQYFGEGCDYIGNEVFQLTWKERKVFVYDANTLKLKRTMEIPEEIKEGWGLAKRVTKDSKNKDVVEFYVSDGGTDVYVVDPKTFKVKEILKVQMEGCFPFDGLNELEFVDGKLWANVFFAEYILIINPDDGFVEGIVFMDGITAIAKQEAVSNGQEWDDFNDVLNGIAYCPDAKKLLITGKRWPLMFEISAILDNS